jgi:thiamine biosynthesis lipoprotein ApbE
MKRLTHAVVALAALLALALPLSAATSAPKEAKAAKVASAPALESPSIKRQYTAASQLAIGVPVQVTIVATSSEGAQAQAAASAAIARAVTFDQAFFAEGGIAQQLSTLPPGQPLTLPPDGFEFLSRAVKLATLTGGWFDIAGPSAKSFFTKRDWRRIALDEKAHTVTLKSSGMALDLSRAAIGFVADLVMEDVTKQGFADAMVEVGSVHRNSGKDIFTPWNITIGFGDGDASENAHRAYRYDITNVAAATVTADGLGANLLDPRNKKPVDGSAIRSITVLAADAMTAEAFALAAYTIGPKFGLQFIEAHPETRGILVDRSGRVLASRGLTIVAASQEQSDAQRAAAALGGSNDLRQKQNEERMEQ